MNKFYKLAVRLASSAVTGGSAFVALAQAPVTAPIVPQTETAFTKETLYAQIAVYVNYAVALVGIVSVVMLMYGAYMYMTAGANEDNAKKGKNAVVFGVIGAVVAVLAFSIFSFAKSLVG